ncbi:MAG: substrate-binding domain-containing protein [Spirochaetales bacterium]|nr:substrate-binding domain-containing protein [Spirochaetales bacterium]
MLTIKFNYPCFPFVLKSLIFYTIYVTNHKRSKKKTLTNTMTIGIAGDVLNYDIPIMYFMAIKNVVLKYDVNVLYFTTKPIRSPYNYDIQSNILYDMISEQNIDGLIIESNILVSYVSQKELIDLCCRYHPLPIVSIGVLIEGIPSVLNDNTQGTYKAVSHLIEVHGHKRIAYLQGPEDHPDVQERYNGYIRALDDHGIILDEKLILPGDFRTSTGNKAVSMLIDQRKMKPGRDFDAIVCANDYMAFGVNTELQTRGVQVPEDIAVVGFDDIYISRFYCPALSTVRQFFDEMGRRAAELLINRIKGENTPDVIKVPAKYIQRQSCGCEYSGEIETEQTLELPADVSMAISSNPSKFLQYLSNKILYSELSREELLGWDQVMTLLRHHKLWDWGVSDNEKDISLGQHAWSVMGKTSYTLFENIINARSILVTRTGLISTLDISELMNILERELPGFGIHKCYLALYENPPPFTYPQTPPEWSRLILAFDKNGRIDLPPEGIIFPTRNLIPEEFLKQQDRMRMLVDALYFQKEHVGFWLLDVWDATILNEKVYPILTSQISSSLKSALLFRELAAANKEIRKLNKQLKDENLRINTEMEVARHIQIALLPEVIKTIHPDFEITARMLTAVQVSGDYYDISLDREGVLWLGIGDVSGHGVASGMVMMMAQTIHTAITLNYNVSARDIVVMVNDILFRNITGRMGETPYMTFTTLKYLGQGRFQYAGLHLDLLIYRQYSRVCEVIETEGMWLNVKPDIREDTKNAEFFLGIGDVLILFTDGLTEVFNWKRELLDIYGFKDIVTAHGGKDVEVMQEAIFRDVINWCNGEYSDDMSLVVVQRIR